MQHNENRKWFACFTQSRATHAYRWIDMPGLPEQTTSLIMNLGLGSPISHPPIEISLRSPPNNTNCYVQPVVKSNPMSTAV